MESATSRHSSSAGLALQKAMHSLKMYTDGPEMNFRTESLLFPQNEQRRCLSCDMGIHVGGQRAMGPRRAPAPGTSGCKELMPPATRVKRAPAQPRRARANALVKPCTSRLRTGSGRHRRLSRRLDDLAAMRDHVVDDPVLLRV